MWNKIFLYFLIEFLYILIDPIDTYNIGQPIERNIGNLQKILIIKYCYRKNQTSEYPCSFSYENIDYSHKFGDISQFV